MSTYSEAGVDLDAAERLVERIGPAVTGTWGPGVVGSFGGFAGGIRLPDGYTNPVLMMSTDGVGTKGEVARQAGMVDGLGYDLVAMCVDDLAAVGATPIALTDYIAVGSLDTGLIASIVDSIAAACRSAGVALLGGETAEHPGVMERGAFDLSAAALGVVEEGHAITGDEIHTGDVVIGLASAGVRSNGFSLIRSAVLDHVDFSDTLSDGRTVAAALLTPSRIYAPAISSLVAEVPVHGLAHITGGGLAGNLVRSLPGGLAVEIDRSTWSVPPLFEWIAAEGGIDEDEMFRVFNMGIGFCVVVHPADVSRTIDLLQRHGHAASFIGAVADGDRNVHIT